MLFFKKNTRIEHPDIKVDSRFSDVKSANDIKYQYYAKYGFTDIAEHYRVIKSINIHSMNFDTWTRLPLNYIALNKIQKIFDKTDTIPPNDFNPTFEDINVFNDIMIETFMFKTDTIETLPLKNGFYKITDSSINIIDLDKNVIYEEYHTYNKY